MKTVAIGSVAVAKLCIVDGDKIAKIRAHNSCELTRDGHRTDLWACKCRTYFENENGYVYWVWSNYIVQID